MQVFITNIIKLNVLHVTSFEDLDDIAESFYVHLHCSNKSCPYLIQTMGRPRYTAWPCILVHKMIIRLNHTQLLDRAITLTQFPSINII